MVQVTRVLSYWVVIEEDHMIIVYYIIYYRKRNSKYELRRVKKGDF